MNIINIQVLLNKLTWTYLIAPKPLIEATFRIQHGYKYILRLVA